MTRTDVCVHGSLRRQCETCDLAEELAEARAEIARLDGTVAALRDILMAERTYWEGETDRLRTEAAHLRKCLEPCVLMEPSR